MISIAPKPDLCMISFNLRFDSHMRRCGVALNLDHNADKAYFITLDKQYSSLRFRSYLMETELGWRVLPNMTELERPLMLIDGKDYNITIIIDKTICEIYVNDDIAMSSRMYDLSSNLWGIFSIGKNTNISGITLYE